MTRHFTMFDMMIALICGVLIGAALGFYHVWPWLT